MSQQEPGAEEMARTLKSEAAKVRRWLRSHQRHFEARQYAGFDTREEAQVRRWLDMLARNLDMDAEELEENGYQGNAGENPRAQGRHSGGGRPAGHVAVPMNEKRIAYFRKLLEYYEADLEALREARKRKS